MPVGCHLLTFKVKGCFIKIPSQSAQTSYTVKREKVQCVRLDVCYAPGTRLLGNHSVLAREEFRV